MRTTLSLDADVLAAVDEVRRTRGLGLSEAVNELVRRGISSRPATGSSNYELRSARVGIKVDVANVAEVLELLDER